jgi:RND family efflux transporter MFP subunit
VLALAASLLLSLTASAQVTRSFTEPSQQSQVAAAEPGVVVKIFVTEGQSVTTGQLLAELDSNALQQSLRIAKLRAGSTSELESAEALLKIRKNRSTTIASMLEKGHANPSEAVEAELEREVAASQVREARQKLAEHQLEVERIQAQLESRMIFAPIDGVITDLHCRKGEYISSNEPRFATVVRLNELLVRFYLLEDEVTQLRARENVDVLIGQPKDRIKVQGTINFVSPVTNSDSGTARVEVVIANRDLTIRSGTPCQWLGNSQSTAQSQSASSRDLESGAVQ